MTNLSFRFGGFSVDFFNGFFSIPPKKIRLDLRPATVPHSTP